MTFVEIHGKNFEYNSDLRYGLYLSKSGCSKLSFSNIFDRFNKRSYDETLKTLNWMKDEAEEQLEWKYAPRPLGILEKRVEMNPKFKKYINNTKILVEELMQTLEGKKVANSKMFS